jgi:hypothetical protein
LLQKALLDLPTHRQHEQLGEKKNTPVFNKRFVALLDFGHKNPISEWNQHSNDYSTRKLFQKKKGARRA